MGVMPKPNSVEESMDEFKKLNICKIAVYCCIFSDKVGIAN